MKYTISGFSQLAAVNFNLDSVDLHMLRWIVDFIDSNRMRCMTLDGEKYYWVSYQVLIDDLPILYLIDCQYKCNILCLCCSEDLCRCFISKTLARSIIYYIYYNIKLILSYSRKIKSFRIKLS